MKRRFFFFLFYLSNPEAGPRETAGARQRATQVEERGGLQQLQLYSAGAAPTHTNYSQGQWVPSLSLSACIPVGASGLSDWGAPTKKKGLLLSLLRVCVYYALLSQTHIYWGAVVGFRLQLSFRHVPWKLFYSWIITILNHNNVCVVASCRVVQYHWWFGCKDGFCRHSSSRWT